MAFYWLKEAFEENGSMYLSLAHSGIRPKTYYKAEYCEGMSMGDKLVSLFQDILKGTLVPEEGCFFDDVSINNIATAMFELVERAPSITRKFDRDYGEEYAERLYFLVANIATVWFYSKPHITKEQLRAVKALNENARHAYSEKRELLKANGIIIIRAAVRSEFFNGYDAFIAEGGRFLLGVNENYDNAGHYNNADGSAIFIDCNQRQADALFDFFGQGYLPSKMKGSEFPEIDWDELVDIPGAAAVKCFYEHLRKEAA